MKRTIIEKIGNIEAVAKQNGLNDWTITLLNGTDVLGQDGYKTNDPMRAIEDMMQKNLDTYTEDYLFLCVPGSDRLSENTYKVGNDDWFCRIDKTRYFKHYLKSASEFIRGKNGLKIIDK